MHTPVPLTIIQSKISNSSKFKTCSRAMVLICCLEVTNYTSPGNMTEMQISDPVSDLEILAPQPRKLV